MNADCPHSLATSTPSPLGNLGFCYVWLAHPGESVSYVVRFPPAVGLASGFLQTPPRDDALALGSQLGLPPL